MNNYEQSKIQQTKNQNEQSAQNAGKSGMAGSNQSFSSNAMDS